MLVLVTLLTGCIPDLTSPKTGECEAGTLENAWPSVSPPGDLKGEGFGKGQTILDGCLDDQNGEKVAVYQFYSRVFVLDVSTIWCEPCQELAGGLQTIADEFGPDEFSYLTVLPQNLEGDIPTTDQLLKWGSDFSISEPILSDGTGYSAKIVTDNAFPKVLLVGRDMTLIQRINPPSDDTIRDAILQSL